MVVFWDALGVEAETTLLLVSTLEHQFVDGRSMVSHAAASTPMLTSVIMAGLTTAWLLSNGATPGG